MVVATQNPIDMEGTYALPEAQLDRFLMKLTVGYPSHEYEVQIVGDALARRLPEQLDPVLTIDELQQMIDVVRGVYVAPALQAYIVTIAAATRAIPQLRLGASPRASNALAQAAQAAAAMNGRSFVTADDIKRMAPVGARTPAGAHSGGGGPGAPARDHRGPDPHRGAGALHARRRVSRRC